MSQVVVSAELALPTLCSNIRSVPKRYNYHLWFLGMFNHSDLVRLGVLKYMLFAGNVFIYTYIESAVGDRSCLWGEQYVHCWFWHD